MELFQTIWTALTTENEFLTKIILIPESFLENFISMLLFTTILNVTSDNKSKIKYVLMVSILGNISNLFIPNPFKSLINMAAILICIKLCFNTNIIKTILSLIIPTVFAIIAESLLAKVFTYLFDFNVAALSSIPIYRLMITLSIQLLMFIIYLLIKYSKVQILMLENMSKKSKAIVLFNFAVAIIAMAVQFIITGFYLEKLPIYIVILSNLTLIAYFLLSIYSLTKTTQLELTALNLESEKENNKMLQEMQDELHTFRHDFSNILCTIGGYIQVKDMNGLKKYYSQIQKDVTKMNNLGALNSEVINNPAVFILISSKYSKALELGIEMNINVFLNLNSLNMKIYEFTRILGILLDNAIEAAKECDEKIINIEIRKDINRNRQLLIIENTYAQKDIDTEKIFEKKFSTKEGNTGLGLWEVRQILKKNHNLNLFTTKDATYFKQQLEMYNQ